MATILFDFSASGAARAVSEVKRVFQRAGQQIVSSDVAQGVKKRAGIAFRNVLFTFADGQTVDLAVKETGDIFEVKINGKVQPLRQQDDHIKAVGEIASYLDRKRDAFQRALARVKVPLPPSIRTSRKNMLAAKVVKRDALREAVGIKREELAELAASS